MNPRNIMRELAEAMENRGLKEKVIRTVDLTPEQKEELELIMAIRDKAEKLDDEADSRKKLFYGKLEVELGEFTRKIRIDTETNKIEVIEYED